MTTKNELPDIFKNVQVNEQLNLLEQKALNIISDMSKQYVEWTTNDVLKLKKLMEQIYLLTDTEQETLIRNDLYRTAHDIKGQGTTFDYPLMSDLGAHICALIKTTSSFKKHHLDIISKDIDDMLLVLTKKLQGDGGQLGANISNRLQTEN
ncbi:MAG: hypothetical protein IKV03_00725 [Alphaproteobacteria bacterium]|nr:hypothetical protein [Alphaproteobacteria bacterium]